MYTDIVTTGQEVLDPPASVARGKQEFLISLLQHSLFHKDMPRVTVGVAGNSEVLEVLRDGGLLLRDFTAPARYWLVFPEAPPGASSFWVQFECQPPKEDDEAEHELKLAHQHGLALANLRSQHLTSWRTFSSGRK